MKHLRFLLVLAPLMGVVVGCGSVNSGNTHRNVSNIRRNDPMMGQKFLTQRSAFADRLR